MAYTQNVAINDKSSINYRQTIGIGFYTDSVSNISNQFYLYDVLLNNPLHDKDKKTITPILTFRRGLCEYYLNGTKLPDYSTFFLWHERKLIGRYSIPNGRQFSFYGTFKKLYAMLDSTISGNPVNIKHINFKLSAVSALNFLSTKGVQYNMLLNAPNWTPPLDDYIEISQHYLKTQLNDDTAGLAKVLTPEFMKLSIKKKRKNPFYSSHEYLLTDFERILPPSSKSADEHLRGRREDPLHKLVEKSRNGKMTRGTISYLETIYPSYTSTKLSGFFFESSMLDSKLKDAARDVILPLYKIPGTVLTYLQCGRDFNKNEDADAAIECFSSGLLLVNNLNATPSFKQYLKAALFNGLAASYRINNQFASSFICEHLSALHQKLELYHVYAADDTAMLHATQNVANYFQKMEADALDARSKKRAAIWNSILAVTTATVSAVNDGLNKSSTPSPQTQELLNHAVDLSGKATEIKFASLNATSKEAEIFNKSFHDMLTQMHEDANSMNGGKPLFAIDLIEILADKNAANALKPELTDFLTAIPAMRSFVNSYFSSNAAAPSFDYLKRIYISFATLELNLYATEATGTATDKKYLEHYQ